MEFDIDTHNIWKGLYTKQLPGTQSYACSDYLEGFDLLQLPEDQIPSTESSTKRFF